MSTEAAADTTESPAGEAPPPAPWDAGIYDPAKPGHFVSDWYAKAPEEEREVWIDYKDKTNPLDIIRHERKQRIDTQTALRNKPLSALPPKPEGDAATPEAWAAYRQARGLPVDPKGYDIKRPDDFPEALWREQEAEKFAAFALEQELSPTQVKELAKWQAQLSKEALTAHEAWVAEQQQAQEQARLDFIKSEKETLIRNHGARVDNVKNIVMDLLKTKDLPAEAFDPNSPQWMGAKNFEAMAFLASLNPLAGDSTGRDFGKASGASAKTADYFRNLKPTDDDWKALADPMHPRSKQVRAESDAAYETEAVQKRNR